MIAPFAERARSASRSSQAQTGPPTGNPRHWASVVAGSGPVVIWRRDSRGRLGNASGSSCVPYRKGRAGDIAHKKTPPPDATDDGVSALHCCSRAIT